MATASPRRDDVRSGAAFPNSPAPKLLEQLELPLNTSPEARLLRLIAKVPGLQKLGQVIARNQHLRPALRNALARLENGIRDVRPEEIRAIIQQDLGPQLKKLDVKIAPIIFSEASVSAVVRFTWRNPKIGRRQRGVIKVMKPHITEYFAEDMDYLQGLAQYFGDQHHTYGFPPHLIPDTFKKVQRLLQHEVTRLQFATIPDGPNILVFHPFRVWHDFFACEFLDGLRDEQGLTGEIFGNENLIGRRMKAMFHLGRDLK